MDLRQLRGIIRDAQKLEALQQYQCAEQPITSARQYSSNFAQTASADEAYEARFMSQVTKFEALCIVEHGILFMLEICEQIPMLPDFQGSMNCKPMFHTSGHVRKHMQPPHTRTHAACYCIYVYICTKTLAALFCELSGGVSCDKARAEDWAMRGYYGVKSQHCQGLALF